MKQPGSRSNRSPQPCVHHWLCGDQRATIVHAVCKKCGAEADFEQHWYSHGILKRNQLKSASSPAEVVSASP
jgi:hypothetical protein